MQANRIALGSSTGASREVVHLCRARSASLPVRRPDALSQTRHARILTPRFASSNEQNAATSSTDGDDSDLSPEQIRKFSELRKLQEQQKGTAEKNVILGAIEEAKLITWPDTKKAFGDTILVLIIVGVSGGALLGMNILLANLSDLWYGM